MLVPSYLPVLSGGYWHLVSPVLVACRKNQEFWGSVENLSSVSHKAVKSLWPLRRKPKEVEMREVACRAMKTWLLHWRVS